MGKIGSGHQDERGVLKDHLREKGQRLTGPRLAVLEEFLTLERHVTAEELFIGARRRNRGVSLSTVFRTVKLLVEAGVARETCPDQGARRYEHVYRHSHHDHLVCVRCGAVKEFSDEAIERAQIAIYRRFGYTPAGHRLELQGECQNCAKRSPNGSGKESG